MPVLVDGHAYVADRLDVDDADLVAGDQWRR
jgi:hypothetical protein